MTFTRILTALVLMPAVIAVVLFTSLDVVSFSTFLVTTLALWEYFALGDAIGHRAYRFWTLFCALLLVFAQRSEAIRSSNAPTTDRTMGFTGFREMAEATSLTWIFWVFILGLTVLTLSTRRARVEVLPSAGISSSALLLVAFPLSYAIRLDGIPTYGSRLLLFALAITWAADTVAYFAGRAFGRSPMAPRLSPKKTWEGSMGGLLGSLLTAYAFRFWLPLTLPHLLAMAVFGNVAGQAGDLLESACKRSAGVKDSGGLLPGHGGILDRIDALILCIPAIWYYLVLVNPRM